MWFSLHISGLCVLYRIVYIALPPPPEWHSANVSRGATAVVDGARPRPACFYWDLPYCYYYSSKHWQLLQAKSKVFLPYSTVEISPYSSPPQLATCESKARPQRLVKAFLLLTISPSPPPYPATPARVLPHSRCFGTTFVLAAGFLQDSLLFFDKYKLQGKKQEKKKKKKYLLTFFSLFLLRNLWQKKWTDKN